MKTCFGIFRFADIFYKLVRTNLWIARQGIVDQIVNLCIWTGLTLFIMGYIMQQFGLSAHYGAFQFASIVGAVGIFEIYNAAVKNIMDIDGDRNISYYLTLPAQPSVILASMAFSYSLISMLLTVFLLPFGGFVLYNRFNFADISWGKFAVIAFLSHIFFGVFMVAMTAHVGTISKMRNIWMRFIWPLWFLGCYQFSWAALYALSAPFAYLLLCNPIVFVMEGTRAALLGQQNFLPWITCCIALCFFIGAFAMYAHHKMKRLLDFV